MPPSEPPPSPPPSPAPIPDEAAAPGITITMLSRGKGVPPEARRLYSEMRRELEAQRGAAVTEVTAKRIGIEGEARLCVRFSDAAAARAAYDQFRKRAAGVDLLEVAQAPCPNEKDMTP